MATLEAYSEQAKLSLAAYARNLTSLTPNEQYRRALEERGMSAEQARIFATEYSVVDQFTDLFTGFSATIFDKNGVKYVAIRGTEGSFSGVADWLTNIEGVGSEGIAISQGLSLVNYFQRLYAPNGAPVVQYTYNFLSKTMGTTLGTGTGLLAQVGLSVTGHSLGAHLAMILSRAAPEIVGSITTFNAPGFDTEVGQDIFPLTSEGFFNALRNTGILPETGPIGTAWNGGIMSHIAVDGDVVHSIGVVPGGPAQIVFTESANEGVVDAHQIDPITDSLALHAVFEELNPGVTLAVIASALEAISRDVSGSLEAGLDALRKLFRDPVGTSFASTSRNDREQYYTNLNDLDFRGKVALYAGSVSISSLAGEGAESLVSQAAVPSGIAYGTCQ